MKMDQQVNYLPNPRVIIDNSVSANENCFKLANIENIGRPSVCVFLYLYVTNTKESFMVSYHPIRYALVCKNKMHYH
jgi:hypothetical protein